MENTEKSKNITILLVFIIILFLITDVLLFFNIYEKFPSVFSVPKKAEEQKNSVNIDFAYDAFYGELYENSDQVGSATLVAANYVNWQTVLGMSNALSLETTTIIKESLITQDYMKLYCLDNLNKFMAVNFAKFQFNAKNAYLSENRLYAFIAAFEYGNPLQYSSEEQKRIITKCSVIIDELQKNLKSKMATMEPLDGEVFYTGKYGSYYYYLDRDRNLVIEIS